MTNIEPIQEVLQAYGFEKFQYEPFGTGLINGTWKISTPDGNYILQKINLPVLSRIDWSLVSLNLTTSILNINIWDLNS